MARSSRSGRRQCRAGNLIQALCRRLPECAKLQRAPGFKFRSAGRERANVADVRGGQRPPGKKSGPIASTSVRDRDFLNPNFFLHRRPAPSPPVAFKQSSSEVKSRDDQSQDELVSQAQVSHSQRFRPSRRDLWHRRSQWKLKGQTWCCLIRRTGRRHH